MNPIQISRDWLRDAKSVTPLTGAVWFGEGLDQGIWDNAEKAARTSEVLLVVGTSAVVYPAASLVPMAKRAGARMIETDPDENPLTCCES